MIDPNRKLSIGKKPRVIKLFNIVSLLSDHTANASFYLLLYVPLEQSVSNRVDGRI